MNSPPHPLPHDRVPRLIATDLDGTFLSPDGSVSPENADAVRAAQQAGITVIFATGRPVRWLDVVRDLPGAHPTVIASNGAMLYDLQTREPLDQIWIDPEVALDAVRAIRQAVRGAAFGFESGLQFGYEPAYRTVAVDDGSDPALFTGPAEEIAHRYRFVKMLVQHRDLAADALMEQVEAVVETALTVTHSAGKGRGLVELSGPGVSKASMLQRCAARLGIDSSDIAAFGDMPNDIAMLQSVGLPRVVANAHPLVLDLGYPIVPANSESGVGRTIRAWLR